MSEAKSQLRWTKAINRSGLSRDERSVLHAATEVINWDTGECAASVAELCFLGEVSRRGYQLMHERWAAAGLVTRRKPPSARCRFNLPAIEALCGGKGTLFRLRTQSAQQTAVLRTPGAQPKQVPTAHELVRSNGAPARAHQYPMGAIQESAPAPQRPPARAQSGSASAVTLVRGGAEALKRQTDARRSLALLTAATFSWAAQHQRTVPHLVAVELADLPDATPIRVAYALEQIQATGAKPVNGHGPPNPIGQLIDALGGQHRRPGKPWEVPPWFAATWAKGEAARAAMQTAADALEQIRARRVREPGNAARPVGARMVESLPEDPEDSAT